MDKNKKNVNAKLTYKWGFNKAMKKKNMNNI